MLIWRKEHIFRFEFFFLIFVNLSRNKIVNTIGRACDKSESVQIFGQWFEKQHSQPYRSTDHNFAALNQILWIEFQRNNTDKNPERQTERVFFTVGQFVQKESGGACFSGWKHKNTWPRMDYQLPAQNMSIVVDNNNTNGNPTTQQQLQQLMLVNSCKEESWCF